MFLRLVLHVCGTLICDRRTLYSYMSITQIVLVFRTSEKIVGDYYTKNQPIV